MRNTITPISASDDTAALEVGERMARFAFRALEDGITDIGADRDRLGAAIDNLENAQSHIQKALHQLAVADIRAELRSRFPDAVALELGLSGRADYLVRYTPHRVVGATGETLWGYQPTHTFDDTRPMWERQLEASCQSLHVIDGVSWDLPVVGSAIAL